MSHRPVNRLRGTSPPVSAVNGKQAEDITSAMQRVRSDLRRDVEEITHQVHEATQWKTYVRRYPFACLAVAAALGYSLVPRRKEPKVVTSPEMVEKLVKSGRLHIEATEGASRKPSLAQQAMLGLGTVAARAVMAYFGKRLGEILPTGESDVGSVQ